MIFAKIISKFFSDTVEDWYKHIEWTLFFSKFSSAFLILHSSLSIAVTEAAPSLVASIASIPGPSPEIQDISDTKDNEVEEISSVVGEQKQQKQHGGM